ncbi:uncharacterized protein LOC118276776 isoform X3 [Spodoptera frugiperda]|uniref:Uncharacterized protein LOC118276776 isoform X3 n=1 Tax=Spodoptera frugiperda TaxID=7108 RepID=A0A9R0DXJ9_SPOFR|nr:uncharacterized protein LOC118276776 isoform X3 [Spodoptera frugiperda]
MASQFHIYFTLSLVFLSVNCLINNGQRSSDVIHGQNAARHSSASRFRRQSPLLVPNTVYRGSSYGTQSVPYGTQAAGYGVNRAPTVVVSVPDDNYMTPVLSNPYVPRI